MNQLTWHTKGPFVFENVVNENVCKNLIHAFTKSIAKPRTFNGLLQREFRCADFVILGTEFMPLFQTLVKDHLEHVLGIACSLEFPHPPIMYRYPVGPGFKVHHDGVNEQEVQQAKITGQPVMGGDVTMILGINAPSEYQGGELFFPNHDMQIKFAPGTVVAYPNTEEYLHGVMPITAGERYSVVCRVNISAPSAS